VIDLQYEYVPPAFRYDAFKLVREHCSEDEEAATLREYILYRGASIAVNSDYFRLYGQDDIMEYYSPDLFVDLLLKSEWHEVLSIVEYLINEGPLSKKEVNKLFEYHSVGYEVEKGPGGSRVLVKYSALIADNDRILSSDVPFAPVIAAVAAAKEALVDPKKIDVASSVGLSVAAVEAYLRGWLETKGLIKAATLGDAVKALRKQSLCPGHIVESLERFYVYRSRTENVGHGAPKFADITREDALLCNEMAVSFINYFHRRGANARQSTPAHVPDSAHS
jgi:hypothetical protein